jgi:hypothetical protein
MREMSYLANNCPMRAVLVVLSPGTSLPFKIAGRPATLYVKVLNFPVVWATEKETRDERAQTEARMECILNYGED